MNFWHMQLHPDEPYWERERELLKTHSVIGFSHQSEQIVRDFRRTMKKGDIVAIRRGSEPIALVEVVGGYECKEDTHDENRLDWFEERRAVKVLDMQDRYDFNIPMESFSATIIRGTLAICDNGDEPAATAIRDWYQRVSNTQ